MFASTCLVLMLFVVHTLIQFTQSSSLYVEDFILAMKIKEANLYQTYVDYIYFFRDEVLQQSFWLDDDNLTFNDHNWIFNYNNREDYMLV